MITDMEAMEKSPWLPVSVSFGCQTMHNDKADEKCVITVTESGHYAEEYQIT